MKRLLQIGILLILMVGVFSVQAGIDLVLVDDDVGIEYIDNTEISDNTILLVVLEIPGQVAAPLKYLILDAKHETTIIGNTSQDICFEAFNDEFTNLDQNRIDISDKMLTNLNRQLRDDLSKQIVIIMGLSRLEIGESLQKNIV